jgi:hypothetical protein
MSKRFIDGNYMVKYGPGSILRGVRLYSVVQIDSNAVVCEFDTRAEAEAECRRLAEQDRAPASAEV